MLVTLLCSTTTANMLLCSTTTANISSEVEPAGTERCQEVTEEFI
jgi:hypothetical protein